MCRRVSWFTLAKRQSIRRFVSDSDEPTLEALSPAHLLWAEGLADSDEDYASGPVGGDFAEPQGNLTKRDCALQYRLRLIMALPVGPRSNHSQRAMSGGNEDGEGAKQKRNIRR